MEQKKKEEVTLFCVCVLSHRDCEQEARKAELAAAKARAEQEAKARAEEQQRKKVIHFCWSFPSLNHLLGGCCQSSRGGKEKTCIGGQEEGGGRCPLRSAFDRRVCCAGREKSCRAKEEAASNCSRLMYLSISISSRQLLKKKRKNEH